MKPNRKKIKAVVKACSVGRRLHNPALIYRCTIERLIEAGQARTPAVLATARGIIAVQAKARAKRAGKAYQRFFI